MSEIELQQIRSDLSEFSVAFDIMKREILNEYSMRNVYPDNWKKLIELLEYLNNNANNTEGVTFETNIVNTSPEYLKNFFLQCEKFDQLFKFLLNNHTKYSHDIWHHASVISKIQYHDINELIEKVTFEPNDVQIEENSSYDNEFHFDDDIVDYEIENDNKVNESETEDDNINL